jgi:hypothetical protein
MGDGIEWAVGDGGAAAGGGGYDVVLRWHCHGGVSDSV